MTEKSRMTARNKKNQPGREEVTFGGSGEARSARVKEFLRRAPQFTSLVEAAEGRRRELSPSQKAFLDDFASELAEGATCDGETS